MNSLFSSFSGWAFWVILEAFLKLLQLSLLIAYLKFTLTLDGDIRV